MTEKDLWDLYLIQCRQAGERYEEIEPWAWAQLQLQLPKELTKDGKLKVELVAQ